MRKKILPLIQRNEHYIYIGACIILVVLTALNRNYLSILGDGVEGDGPGYISYARGLKHFGIQALDPFWQPGYACLILLLSLVNIEPFYAGVIVSCIAALVFLLISYALLRRMFSGKVAVLALILVGSSTVFITNACSVNADMLYAALFMCSLYFIFKNDECSLVTMVLAGFFAGLAYMVKHQALILIVPMIIKSFASKKRWYIYSAVALLSLIITALPVFITYYIRFGDPFYNEHYLNFAGAVYSQNMNTFFHNGLFKEYNSLAYVLLKDPLKVALFLMKNFIRAIADLFTGTHHIMFLWVFTIIGFITMRRKKEVYSLIIIILGLLSALPVKMHTRYLIGALPFVMAFASAGLHTLIDFIQYKMENRLSLRLLPSFTRLMFIICLGIGIYCSISITKSEDPLFKRVGMFMRNHIDRNDHQTFLSIYPFHVSYYANRRGKFLISTEFNAKSYNIDRANEALYTIINEQKAGYIVYFFFHEYKNPAFHHLIDPEKAPAYLEMLAINPDPKIIIYQLKPMM